MLFTLQQVQAEFKKVWRRHVTDRTGSTRTTRTFMSRTRNSVKIPSPSNGNAPRHSDVKHQSGSESLSTFKKETSCDSEEEGGVVDTDLGEETRPCLNNNETVPEPCDKHNNARENVASTYKVTRIREDDWSNRWGLFYCDSVEGLIFWVNLGDEEIENRVNGGHCESRDKGYKWVCVTLLSSINLYFCQLSFYFAEIPLSIKSSNWTDCWRLFVLHVLLCQGAIANGIAVNFCKHIFRTYRILPHNDLNSIYVYCSNTLITCYLWIYI